MDDREFSNVYTIPPNYTDSGKLLGGMLETRNTIEAVFLLLLVGYPEPDVDAPAGHRKGCGDDHDAAADGRIRAHGDLAAIPCSNLPRTSFCSGCGVASSITGG